MLQRKYQELLSFTHLSTCQSAYIRDIIHSTCYSIFRLSLYIKKYIDHDIIEKNAIAQVPFVALARDKAVNYDT